MFDAGFRSGRPHTISTPMHNPSPRISPMKLYWSIKSARPSRRTLPTILAEDTSFSLFITSSTALPTAQAKGLPPSYKN